MELGQRGTDRGHPLPLPFGPDEALGKILELRDMLFGEREFETRYPEAYRMLFTPPHEGDFRGEGSVGGLPLPSFGIRVRLDEPTDYFGSGWGERPADAYSSSVDRDDFRGLPGLEPAFPPARQSWVPVHSGHARSVLLAILSREEYTERIEPLGRRGGGAIDRPEAAPIRITDLRLDACLEHPEVRDALLSSLSSIERPLTQSNVVEWKARASLEFSDAAGPSAPEASPLHGFRKAFMSAVAFSSAALLLFIDLDVPETRNATTYRLVEQVESLAELVEKLLGTLDRTTRRFEKLIANRCQGNSRTKDIEYYFALRDYRLGTDLKEIAARFGLSPWDSQSIKGTKDWKTKTEDKIRRGKELEDEHYPEASAIIDSEDQSVREKARQAYRAFVRARDEALEVYEPSDALALGMHQAAVEELGGGFPEADLTEVEAYVQLGCCLECGRPTVP